MPPEASGSDSAREWIRYAQADMDLARVQLPPRGMYESLCFHAQQAIEKSIKAVLVHAGVEVPNTHSIQRLVGLLPAGVPRQEFLLFATRLTAYAVSSRYPGENEPVLEGEYLEAIEVAEKVLAWAEVQVCSETAD